MGKPTISLRKKHFSCPLLVSILQITAEKVPQQDFSAQAQAVVQQVMGALALLSPSPFKKNRSAMEPVEVNIEASEEEESD